MNNLNRFKAFIVILILCIWISVFSAQFNGYDVNLAMIFYPLVASFLFSPFLLFLIFKKSMLIKKSIWFIVIYAITSSPVSIIIAWAYYQEIFGAKLVS